MKYLHISAISYLSSLFSYYILSREGRLSFLFQFLLHKLKPTHLIIDTDFGGIYITAELLL